jgi:hypothetical protein
VRAFRQREELLLEFAQASTHGFVQTFGALRIHRLEQPLRARGPMSAFEAGGLMGRK